jgi:hypothetical protein
MVAQALHGVLVRATHLSSEHMRMLMMHCNGTAGGLFEAVRLASAFLLA